MQNIILKEVCINIYSPCGPRNGESYAVSLLQQGLYRGILEPCQKSMTELTCKNN